MGKILSVAARQFTATRSTAERKLSNRWNHDTTMRIFWPHVLQCECRTFTPVDRVAVWSARSRTEPHRGQRAAFR
jgi:hypothetical protein